jgi:predicted aspartyl protease
MRVVGLLAAAAALGCATAPAPEQRRGGAWEEIPTRWTGTYVFVDAEINGSRQSLLLDTGSDVTLLDPEVVSLLGIAAVEREFPPVETSSGWSEPARRKCATVQLRVGGMAQEVDALVVPLDMFGRVLGEPVAGVLGFHLWAGVCLRID